ncbi:MAG: aminoacyl-tRNA hydrolase [Clostridia bacterium]|nr:aminoacyl-tRNA hydrolase [Clostridia bacterium]
MYLIVGLGNPENDYARTRHNMGFEVINKLAEEYEIDLSRTKFDGIYGTGIIENEKVILLKPQTFMNNSGESVIQFKNFYKLEENEILVISDDIDIDIEKIRVKRNGSAGSHNGLKSVVHYLQSENFPRVRVGVGQPKEDETLVEYVIGYVPNEEYERLEIGIDKAKEAVKVFLKDGIETAMNKFN